MSDQWTRRDFGKQLLAAGAGLAVGNMLAQAQNTPAPKRNIKLGYDNFAVRAMGWKAPQLIDYAAEIKVDTVFITDLDPFEKQDDAYLGEIRKRAEDKGVQILLGTWSICPTSKVFKNKWGNAEEHLALTIRMAKALGSPVARCVLGTREDRATEGGIEARIADTVKVCQACRSRAVDAGIKITVENHAGDMQAWELVTLVEAAGKDYVGVNLDSGNAMWTLEHPQASLEILGKYAASTSLRDSMAWETPDGAKVQWTAMGEGCVDLKAYFDRFAELCPNVAVNIETISGFAVEFPYQKADFWKVWPKARAADFIRFQNLAKKGHALEPHRSPDAAAEQAYQKGELERSIKYCKEVLGLGLKA